MRGVWRDSAWVFLVALISVLLISRNIQETGDAEQKWLAAKAWAHFDFPQFMPTHHNMRWGTILPAVVAVRLLGSSPLVYMLLNFTVFAAATAGLYALIRMLTTPLVAVVILGIWLINPVVYFLTPDLMPELYTIFYVTMALLVVRQAYATGSDKTFAAAVIIMFIAYGAKETNIFFMAGWGLYELLNRRWRHVAILIGVFAVGYAIENAILNVLFGHGAFMPFARAQVILRQGHLAEMETQWVYKPIDLFARWLVPFPERDATLTKMDLLGYFSKVLFWIFFIITFWKAWSWARARTLAPPKSPIGAPGVKGEEAISIAWGMGLSYAFFTSFFILSFHPLVLGQPLIDRYLWPLLPPVLVTLAAALRGGLERANDAKGGALTFISRARKSLEPWATGKAAFASLFAIAMICTLARWSIEIGTVEIRRRGYELPYRVFNANAYFDQARQHILDGCMLVFPRPRPAETLLTFAFDNGQVSPTEQLFLAISQGRALDGLVIDGRRLHAWPVAAADYASITGRLYTDPSSMPTNQLYAVRLRGGQCTQAYYYGQGDIHPHDQPIEGSITEAPT